MSVRARLAGVRLGLTYGAGLVVLGLTIAALSSTSVTPRPANATLVHPAH
ncbi:MAG: hypothetical protein H7251_10560 [Acetobacteraceae bacterium]|nr:hypothetical protein [Acetobacteraceae bacterium]